MPDRLKFELLPASDQIFGSVPTAVIAESCSRPGSDLTEIHNVESLLYQLVWILREFK